MACHRRPPRSIARRFAAAGIALIGFLAVAPAPASAKTIKVTTTEDQFGLEPGCALREAVQAANGDVGYGGCRAGDGADTISLAGGKTYTRVFGGTGEDQNASGDLDVASRVSVAVRGKGRAKIDATGMDRVIEVLDGGRLSLDRVILTGAAEGGFGAVGGQGVQVSDARLEVTRSRIVNNGAPGTGNGNGNGGGIGGFGRIDIRRSTIAGNYAGNIGGGVFLGNGELTIIESTISGNSSFSAGGGIYFGGAGGPDTATVRGSSVLGNTAGDAGGGIYLGTDANLLSAVNSSISGNTANGGGGGVQAFDGRMKANAITVFGNEAIDNPGSNSTPGGGLAGENDPFSVENSIVAGNTDGSAFDFDDCSGVESEGHNLFAPGGECSKTGSDRLAADPGLRAPAANGGPTPTLALKPGSRAVGGAGRSAPGRDQRGRKRDRNPDIGAYER